MDKKNSSILEAHHVKEISQKYFLPESNNNTAQKVSLDKYKTDGNNRKMELNCYSHTLIRTQNSTRERIYQSGLDYNQRRISVSSYGSSSSMKSYSQSTGQASPFNEFNKNGSQSLRSSIKLPNSSDVQSYPSKLKMPNTNMTQLFPSSYKLPNTLSSSPRPRDINTNSIMYQSPNPNKILPILSKPANGVGNYKFTEPKLILHENFTPKKNLDENLKPADYCIMNFRNFDEKLKKKLQVKEIKDRKSSIKDVQALEKTLKNFKMKGKSYENLKLKEIEQKMKKISEADFSMSSAFVMVIMTHGGKNFELCAKDDLFDLHSKIISKIIKNEHLVNKPKIIFVEACRGQKDPNNQFQTDDWETNTIKTAGDVLIFHATFEEFVSYSHIHSGSFFIQNLCEHLQKKGKTDNIIDICNDVADDVRSKTRDKQIPELRNTLNKELQRYCFGDYCKY